MGGSATRGRFELRQFPTFQFQRLGQLLHGVGVRTASLATLEQPDRLRRQPRAAGKFFLRNASRGSVAPQQGTERYPRAG
jgi:hypothetical protein